MATKTSDLKQYGASLDADPAEAVSAFINKTLTAKVTAPKAPEKFDVSSNRAVPTGVETDDLTPQRDSGYALRFPTSGASTTFAGGADRKTSSRIIILAMGVAGAAIILGGSNNTAYQVGNTKVPGNMRAFAGVVVAGTVALVINEVSPSIGMLFGVSLIFVAVADVQVFANFGNVIFGKGPVTKNATNNTRQSTGGFANSIKNGVIQNPTPQDYQGHPTDPKTGLPQGWPGSAQNPIVGAG